MPLPFFASLPRLARRADLRSDRCGLRCLQQVEDRGRHVNGALNTAARRQQVTEFVSGGQSQDNQACSATMACSSVWTRWFSTGHLVCHATRLATAPWVVSARLRRPRHAGARDGMRFTVVSRGAEQGGLISWPLTGLWPEAPRREGAAPVGLQLERARQPGNQIADRWQPRWRQPQTTMSLGLGQIRSE
jgi:hypothetical protein